MGKGAAGEQLRAFPSLAGADLRAEAATGRGPGLREVGLRRPVGRLRAGGTDGECRPGAGRLARRTRAAGGGDRRQQARCADVSLLARDYPVDAQEQFGKAAAATFGFDFDRGRLDVTAHPFCTTLGPHDCRITTRYDRNFFNSAFFGILHEAGHGIYEQGLPPDQFGLPLGEAVSLGIHESQSRMWENLVGRSRPFWQHFYPAAQAAFPAALGGVDAEAFYFAINDVRPSLIRVEADEATYNLHILIRFELEQALLSGDLPAADASAAWNEKYRQLPGHQL